MVFKLCWMHNSKVKSKKFRKIEDIISLMSCCLWAGEWVENSKGEKIELNWEEICFQNLSLF